MGPRNYMFYNPHHTDDSEVYKQVTCNLKTKALPI